MVAPRLLLHLRKGLSRLPLRVVRPVGEPEPADRDWDEMLARLDDREEVERRLAAAEDALNRLG